MGLLRKAVMVPGNLLPQPQPGKFHGVITKIVEGETAWVTLSDEKCRLEIKTSEVANYLLEDQTGSCGTLQKAKARPPIPGARKKRPIEQGTSQAIAVPQKRRQSVAAAVPHSSKQRQPSLSKLEGKDEAGPSARYGPLLADRLASAAAAVDPGCPPGMRGWCKLRGCATWPVVMWSIKLCRTTDIGDLLLGYCKGRVLVRFYGEHSSMWVQVGAVEDVRQGAAGEAESASGDEELKQGDADRMRALRAWGRQHNKVKLVEAAIEEFATAEPTCPAEIARMVRLQQQYLGQADAAESCDVCWEQGAGVSCMHCARFFHPLCLQPPALAVADVPDAWECPCCGQRNEAGDETMEAEKEKEKIERMGLTPDWIIQAAAFHVFKLERPTMLQPYIKGLLDPCTNSMIAPNIPAEILYDKQVNGLKLVNSWAGYHIILNPDFSAQIQWRFVNRAIDEVENGHVPAVILICRNSTDTAYFQRLRPYPRVLLRRMSALFKDYDKTPIGFGIVVFCIAKNDCRQLYERFYEAFAEQGEPNIPIDQELMHTPEFYALLDRLRRHAEQHNRDHWIQCGECNKWRIINYDRIAEAKDSLWTCRELKPPYTNCSTPQSKREMIGGRYAANGADAETEGLALLCDGVVQGTRFWRADRWQPGGGAASDAGAGLGSTASAQGSDEGEATRQGPGVESSLRETSASSSLPSAQSGIGSIGSIPGLDDELITAAGLEDRAVQEVLDSMVGSLAGCSTSSSCEAEVDVRGVLDCMVDSLEDGDAEGMSWEPTEGQTAASSTALLQDPLPSAVKLSLSVVELQNGRQLQGNAGTSCSVGTQQCAVDSSLSCGSSAARIHIDLTVVGVEGVTIPSSESQFEQLENAASSARAQGVESQWQGAVAASLPDVPAGLIRTHARLPSRSACYAAMAEGEGAVLTALELARHARIAANKAYLEALQLDAAAMAAGQVRPLAAEDPAVLLAARELGRKAAITLARKQLVAAEEAFDANKRRRGLREAALRAALRDLREQEAAEEERVHAARRVMMDLVTQPL